MWQLTIVGIAMWAAVEVEAVSNSQGAVRGELRTLSEDSLEMQTATGPLILSRDDMNELRFDAAKNSAALAQPTAWLTLADGTQLLATAAEMQDGQVRIKPLVGQPFVLPSQFLRMYRWSGPSPELDKQWQDILADPNQEDVVVIRRPNNRLDFSKGVVEAITEKAVKFTFDGNTLDVPRERLDGVVMTAHVAGLPAARYELQTVDGSQWKLDALVMRGEQAIATTVAGAKLSLPLTSLSRLRFAVDKQVLLIDLEPLSTRYEPFLGSELLAEQLQAMFGPRVVRERTLKLRDPENSSGFRTFETGIALHSRSEMVYRLAGEYRRLEALAGLDADNGVAARVQMTILGDDRELLAEDIEAMQTPRRVSVDVRGVNRLTIRVDYGSDSDVGDQLNLCQARLLK